MAKVSQKFIFIAYVLVALAPLVFLQGKNVDTAKLYEELAGRYQFDRGGTPIVLLVYVNEGVLLVDEPRFPHAKMEPVDLDKLEFRANHESPSIY